MDNKERLRLDILQDIGTQLGCPPGVKVMDFLTVMVTKARAIDAERMAEARANLKASTGAYPKRSNKFICFDRFMVERVFNMRSTAERHAVGDIVEYTPVLPETKVQPEATVTGPEKAFAYYRDIRYGDSEFPVREYNGINEFADGGPGKPLFTKASPIWSFYQPTRAMLDAARDWSLKKYGQAIGSEAAIGCWQAMFDALPENPWIHIEDELPADDEDVFVLDPEHPELKVWPAVWKADTQCFIAGRWPSAGWFNKDEVKYWCRAPKADQQ